MARDSIGRTPILSVAAAVAVEPSARVLVAINVTGLFLAIFRKAMGNDPPQPPLFVNRLNVGEALLRLPGALICVGVRVKRQVLQIVGSNLVLENKELTIYSGEFFAGVQRAVEKQEWPPLLDEVRTTSLPANTLLQAKKL